MRHQMKTFIITSEKFEGEIEFKYNHTGQLVSYDNRTNFDTAQHDWLLKNMPTNLLTDLKPVTGLMHGKITEVKVELTFEQFWKQYFAGREKDNSSKKRTEVKWNRMNRADQAKAYAYINTYLGRIPFGVRPKYAETYLNSELWNG